jgi:hypothetical protein
MHVQTSTPQMTSFTVPNVQHHIVFHARYISFQITQIHVSIVPCINAIIASNQIKHHRHPTGISSSLVQSVCCLFVMIV